MQSGLFSHPKNIENMIYGKKLKVCKDQELKQLEPKSKWSCQKLTEALVYLLDNSNIRFGSKRYRKNVGIQMRTNCVPLLLADLFLVCNEIDFVKSSQRKKRNEMIDAFKSTSKGLVTSGNGYATEGKRTIMCIIWLSGDKRARFTNWLFRPCTSPKCQTQLIISPVIFYVI